MNDDFKRFLHAVAEMKFRCSADGRRVNLTFDEWIELHQLDDFELFSIATSTAEAC